MVETMIEVIGSDTVVTANAVLVVTNVDIVVTFSVGDSVCEYVVVLGVFV
jgi:hypothetical protein